MLYKYLQQMRHQPMSRQPCLCVWMTIEQEKKESERAGRAYIFPCLAAH